MIARGRRAQVGDAAAQDDVEQVGRGVAEALRVGRAHGGQCRTAGAAAKAEQQRAQALGLLELRAVPAALQEHVLDVRERGQHVAGARGRDHAVAVAPDEQHRHPDLVQAERVLELGQQPAAAC